MARLSAMTRSVSNTLELSSLRLLVKTCFEKLNKAVRLCLNGEVHQVHIAEIESLNYPVSGAISYTMQEFMAMPMLSQGEDDDDVDKDSDDMDDEVAEFGNFNSFSDGVAGEEILHDGDRFVEGANSKISARLYDPSFHVIINGIDQFRGQNLIPTELFPEIITLTLTATIQKIQ